MGSEMCIRDSLNPAVRRTVLFTPIRPPTPHEDFVTRCQANPKTYAPLFYLRSVTLTANNRTDLLQLTLPLS